MAKPKSMKLRLLVTLHALFKYSDENHRLNAVKLNEYLRPYGVQCGTGRSLGDTVRILKEFGVDVRSKGEWDHQGIWIESRPLPDYDLNRLIFAVTTNPHLSKEQATEILQSLKPIVTVYQEPMLQGLVETEQNIVPDNMLYDAYSVIHKAIAEKRRVRYTVNYLKYNKDAQSVEKQDEWATLFTPKLIYQTKNNLYMVGYNNTDRRIDAINLKNITSIKMAFKHKDPKENMVNQWIADIVPRDHVPGEKQHVIYEGPVAFKCRGQYVGDLYDRFGPPDGPVVKDARSRAVYSVQRAAISSEDLHWLSQIPEHGIRIRGPKALSEAVREYYQETCETLLNPVIKNQKPHT